MGNQPPINPLDRLMFLESWDKQVDVSKNWIFLKGVGNDFWLKFLDKRAVPCYGKVVESGRKL
ncbi:MAG: hypothetical protein G8345_10180 [Magnetococcales bacterium]|nr:hypothetical protein [Magnetococcales bacterium]NGZ27239.1 hypothetical protein [Magnetococcales bacterium]